MADTRRSYTDAELYEMQSRRHLSNRQIARETGLNVNGVRGRIWRYMQTQEISDLKAKVASLEAQLAGGMYAPSPMDDDTDMPAWKAHVIRLKALKRMVKVAQINDPHFPDDDERAIELTFQVLADFEPDVIITGSDCFDFDVLSTKFPRAYNRIRRDAFGEVREKWDAFTTRLRRMFPDAVMVAIGDNHGSARVERYIKEKAPELGDTISAAYNDLIRSDGRVLWLGWKQELRLGPALFEHGLKSGEGAAKASLKQRGWATPKMQGHGHYPSWYVNVADVTDNDGTSQFRYPVVSIMTGHLSNPHAHYAKHTDNCTWVQGIGLAHVNMHGFDVHFQNVLFHPRKDGSLVTVVGAKEYRQPREVARIIKQAA